MKRLRKLVFGGIESKIVALILTAILLVAGTFVTVTVTQSMMLSDLSEQTNSRQLTSITGTTAEVVDTVVEEKMNRITDMEAQITDEMFRDAAVMVRLTGDYARKLLEDPETIPRDWVRPDPDKDGELFVKALFAPGTDEDQAVSDRLKRIVNMSDMMKSLCMAYGADNIWFSLPEGATLMADTVPGEWVLEDKSYKTYDAPNRYWFRQAAEAGHLIFSDVEDDERTHEMCVTCALPVYSADGTLLGVAGTDLFLTEMQQTVTKSSKDGGLLGVVNQDGHVIVAPEGNNMFRALKSEEAPDLRESENRELAQLVKDAQQGKTDIRMIHMRDSAYYMIGVPMKTVGWTMIAAYSEAAVEQPVRTLEDNFSEIREEATSTYRGESTRRNTITLIMLVVLLVLMLTGAVLTGKRIVKPLNSMTRQIANLREGNLEFVMEDSYRTGDEVEVLARSFADLLHKTEEYIEQVRTVTAEKERIGTELHLARQIQEGILPNIFPPYPERHEFDLYASMNPAKEVGGDFYDFFLIDDDHLALVMADVSGKGVPGALFMMVSRTILQNNAMMKQSPAEILAATNEAICANNKMEMFVTVWLGILEISTGRMTAANAGHEYPAIRRNGGEFVLYKDRHGFVIGGMEGVRYREYELDLRPGDSLFLYTDGVPEATNSRQELFGTGRMIDALNRSAGNPEDILHCVRKSVDDFVDGAEQFDDLTMLCLKYRGNAQ